MRRNLILTITLLLSALVLGACGPGPTGGGLPGTYCDSATLVAHLLTDPNDGGIFVLYTSHLFWVYPEPTCEPEDYRPEVSTVSDFSGTMFGAIGG